MGTWSRELYPDGKTFSEEYDETVSPGAGADLLGPIIYVSQGMAVLLSLLTASMVARVLVTYSSRAEVENYTATWEDATAATGAGASDAVNAILSRPPTAVRVHMVNWLMGGTYQLRALCLPFDKLIGSIPKFEIVTPLGGYAGPYILGGASASVAGEIMEQSSTEDYKVVKCPTSSQVPKGYAYHGGVPVGAYVLVTSRGNANALLEDAHAAALGEIALVSAATAGRVTTAVPPGAVDAHFREGGRVLAAVTAGVNKIVPVAIQFN